MIKTNKFDKVLIETPEDLRSWLLHNHTNPESVWLVTYLKSEGDKFVSREEVLDELLCFGWIDGIRRKLDDRRTMQLISPRKVQHWARTYKERAARLIGEGRMHASGLQSIESSKSSGLWNFMDDVDNLVVPADLSSALEALDGASAYFDAINDSSKRFVLRWVKLAKSDKTRENRIKKIADLSARGEKLLGS